jgi:hypothetical protein
MRKYILILFFIPLFSLTGISQSNIGYMSSELDISLHSVLATEGLNALNEDENPYSGDLDGHSHQNTHTPEFHTPITKWNIDTIFHILSARLCSNMNHSYSSLVISSCGPPPKKM